MNSKQLYSSEYVHSNHPISSMNSFKGLIMSGNCYKGSKWLCFLMLQMFQLHTNCRVQPATVIGNIHVVSATLLLTKLISKKATMPQIVKNFFINFIWTDLAQNVRFHSEGCLYTAWECRTIPACNHKQSSDKNSWWDVHYSYLTSVPGWCPVNGAVLDYMHNFYGELISFTVKLFGSLTSRIKELSMTSSRKSLSEATFWTRINGENSKLL